MSIRLRHFSKEGIQMVDRNRKRCSTLLIIREMQTKTTMRYCFTYVRMAITKKAKNNEYWQECGEKGTLLHCWWECKLVQPLWKTVWRFLKKLKLPSVQITHSVVSDSLRPYRLQHARPRCPSLTSGIYSNPCPSRQ